MKIMVIGCGAREHALTAALARSAQNPELYCFASAVNPGIKGLTKGYAVGDILDGEAVLRQAKAWQIHWAVIGPEAPLEAGLADILRQQGIAVIGPGKSNARIETSKTFARDFMKKYQIDGLPQFACFTAMAGVSEFIHQLGEDSYVIKANGLMGGKGVKVAGEHLHAMDEALSFCQQILESGQSILIEEKLVGEEFSCICFADGEHLVPMPLVQDHKRAHVGDTGPNTGGMGSYSMAGHSLPFLSEKEVEQALAINKKTLHMLREESGEPYVGFLYGSFIATAKGVYVIEFNARLGDPEALNLLSLLQSDLVAIFQHMLQGDLSADCVQFAPMASVCKYGVPQGYPDAPARGFEVDISAVKEPECLYWAAVDIRNEVIVATGSRTLASVGMADTLAEAEQQAERAIAAVKGPLFHREDIGTEALLQKRIAHMQQLRAS